MRPLYIYGTGAAVRLDGPALCVSVAASADRWFPLRLISRVLSAERVVWTTEALLACARAGISVTFHDDAGGLVARCFGAPGERQELAQRLADLLDRADWEERYRGWLTAAERCAARSVARRARLKDYAQVTPLELRRIFECAAADLLALPAWRTLGAEIYLQVHSFAGHTLIRHGVDPERFCSPAFDPVRDFARLLFWDFHLARLRWVEARVERFGECKLPTRAEAVAFFEGRRQRTDQLAERIVNRFNRWLVEVFP